MDVDDLSRRSVISTDTSQASIDGKDCSFVLDHFVDILKWARREAFFDQTRSSYTLAEYTADSNKNAAALVDSQPPQQVPIC